MTDDALLVVDTLFTTIWSIFTSWHIPGTNVTPMAMALFLIVACFGLRLLYSLAHSSGSMDVFSDISSLKQRNEDRAKASLLRESRLREVQRKNVNRMNDRLRQRELRNSDYYNDR